jgi:hypothetical protein
MSKDIRGSVPRKKTEGKALARSEARARLLRSTDPRRRRARKAVIEEEMGNAPIRW